LRSIGEKADFTADTKHDGNAQIEVLRGGGDNLALFAWLKPGSLIDSVSDNSRSTDLSPD
jgi:hypothetical protein